MDKLNDLRHLVTHYSSQYISLSEVQDLKPNSVLSYAMPMPGASTLGVGGGRWPRVEWQVDTTF